MLCLYDQPVWIPRDADPEVEALKLEQSMTALRERTDLWREGPDQSALLDSLLGDGWVKHQSEKGRSVANLNLINPTGVRVREAQPHL